MTINGVRSADVFMRLQINAAVCVSCDFNVAPRTFTAMILPCAGDCPAQSFRDGAMTPAMYVCTANAVGSICSGECQILGSRVFDASDGRYVREIWNSPDVIIEEPCHDIPHIRGFIIRIGQAAAAAAAALRSASASASTSASMSGSRIRSPLSRLIPSFRDATVLQKNYAHVRHYGSNRYRERA